MPHLPAAPSAAAEPSAQADAAQLGRQHAFLSSWQQQQVRVYRACNMVCMATGPKETQAPGFGKVSAPSRLSGALEHGAETLVMQLCHLLRSSRGPERSCWHAQHCHREATRAVAGNFRPVRFALSARGSA